MVNDLGRSGSRPHLLKRAELRNHSQLPLVVLQVDLNSSVSLSSDMKVFAVLLSVIAVAVSAP